MLPSYDTLQIKNIINKTWSGCICQVLLTEHVFFHRFTPLTISQNHNFSALYNLTADF